MSTGTELRDQREIAGLSVEKLSALTSIRMGLISEMESNNFSHCVYDFPSLPSCSNIDIKTHTPSFHLYRA